MSRRGVGPVEWVRQGRVRRLREWRSASVRVGDELRRAADEAQREWVASGRSSAVARWVVARRGR